MKPKTSSIPIKSSGMTQLLSYDSHTIHVQTCRCGAVVASFLSLALTPNSPPTPSTIPPLSCLSIRFRLKFGGAKTIKEKSN